jgi:transcriptional regulator
MGRPTDRLFGTLDLLILRALSGGDTLHGYDITERIEHASRDVLTMEEGSLYPALHRMEEAGWVTSRWDVSANNRRARFYTISSKGRRHLKQLEADWTKHVDAVTRVLRAV